MKMRGMLVPFGSILFFTFLTAVPRTPAAIAADAPADNPGDREAGGGPQWKEKLGLTSEQARKFMSAERSRESDLRPLREQLNAGLFKLRTQLAEGATENDVQESLAKLARARKEILDRNDQFDAAVASFLLPSQRAKLLVWKSLLVTRGKSAKGLESADMHEPAPGEEPEPE